MVVSHNKRFLIYGDTNHSMILNDEVNALYTNTSEMISNRHNYGTHI